MIYKVYGLLFSTDDTFAISTNGEASLSKALDREALDSYTLMVIVADSGTPALSSTITLGIQVEGELTFFIQRYVIFNNVAF